MSGTSEDELERSAIYGAYWLLLSQNMTGRTIHEKMKRKDAAHFIDGSSKEKIKKKRGDAKNRVIQIWHFRKLEPQYDGSLWQLRFNPFGSYQDQIYLVQRTRIQNETVLFKKSKIQSCFEIKITLV